MTYCEVNMLTTIQFLFLYSCLGNMWLWCFDSLIYWFIGLFMDQLWNWNRQENNWDTKVQAKKSTWFKFVQMQKLLPVDVSHLYWNFKFILTLTLMQRYTFILSLIKRVRWIWAIWSFDFHLNSQVRYIMLCKFI